MKSTRHSSEPGMLLDIASYARRGPGQRDRLTPADVEHIERTVRRVPEVMVKVLSRGGQDLKAVQRHLDYIGRRGETEIETDEGERLMGRGVEKALLEDWDLDLDSNRRRASLDAAAGQRAPKLAHKLMFSMPAGTPPDKVLAAVRAFAREEFGLKHRYVMALHTDEPHPHVHVVIKAVSEQGVRLHIRKAMLRQWRADFAKHLRALGVPANATHRYIRGETTPRKSDGIYRASLRGQSTHMRERTETVARELVEGGLQIEPGKPGMLRTRGEIRHAWKTVSDILIRQQQSDLAQQLRQFTDRMSPVMTEKEAIAAQLLERARRPSARDRGSLSR